MWIRHKKVHFYTVSSYIKYIDNKSAALAMQGVKVKVMGTFISHGSEVIDKVKVISIL